ncbi:MAG: ATP-binding protein [Proteobacteria bacterium]|nr:ATP-binding protein [Pseudomonadota bacterium]
MLDARPDNRRITAFKQWLAGMWLFSLRPHALDAISLEESDSPHETGGNYASWYRSLVQTRPELAEALREDLAPLIPGLNAPPKVIKTERDARVLVLECAGASGKTFSLGVNELSDGQRALLVLYSILRALAPFTSLLVFDEPDNFVAQTEIQPWLAAMREAVVNAKHGTLLVLSHHPEVIDYLAADQVLYLWRGGGGPTRVRELSIDRDQGLTASEASKLGLADAD